MAELINVRGGSAEVVHLPDVGLHGNTHIPFADLNNRAVADRLSQFLARQGSTDTRMMSATRRGKLKDDAGRGYRSNP